jgi:hypothetical protein
MKKKNKLLQVRITSDQHEKLGLFARTQEMTKSELIRKLISKIIKKLD